MTAVTAVAAYVAAAFGVDPPATLPTIDVRPGDEIMQIWSIPEHFLRRLCHASLGCEVFLLTLFGTLFAIPGGWGCTLILDKKRRWDWLIGAILVVTCLPATVSFYSWAATGDSAAIWRLVFG